MESIQKQLQLLIDEGKQFTFNNFSDKGQLNPNYGGSPTPQWTAWKARVKNLLLKTLDENAAPLDSLSIGLGTQTRGNYADSFENAKSNLLSALEQTLEITKQDTFNELKKAASQSKSLALSNKVFIVHGHDNELKVELENFIKEIGLEPIVLHRKPDEGQTIIEKFEKHSDVGFAFILLTPDEIAYTINQEKKDDGERSKEKRARPNVIFEFGYFVGKLGRNRVCCIYKGGVTPPSDLSGLVYKKVDSTIENQEFSIIKELKAAGYKINI